MPFYVYIIYSERHDKFYVGQTQDVVDRLHRHNCGTEKYTAPYRPWQLKCAIEKSSRSEAIILEKKIKNLNRAKLMDFIAKYS